MLGLTECFDDARCAWGRLASLELDPVSAVLAIEPREAANAALEDLRLCEEAADCGSLISSSWSRMAGKADLPSPSSSSEALDALSFDSPALEPFREGFDDDAAEVDAPG